MKIIKAYACEHCNKVMKNVFYIIASALMLFSVILMGFGAGFLTWLFVKDINISVISAFIIVELILLSFSILSKKI